MSYNFQISRGVYDITVDFSAMTVTVSASDVTKYVLNTNIIMSFWEGPIFNARKINNLNTSDIVFNYYGITDNYIYYKIDVADDVDPVTYVSQCYLGGTPGYKIIAKQEDGSWLETGSYSYSYINSDGETSNWGNFYFDAHTSDVFVPIKKEFWCDNSRMEVGITTKTIFLRYKYASAADLTDNTINETPLEIMFSSDGNLRHDANTQRPLNSDTYSLTLSDGTLYEAMRRTRNGKIEVPFIRHNSAEWGYVINIGHDITTKEAEKFVFNVKDAKGNSKNVNVKFDMSSVNESVTKVDGSESSIAQGLTFNRIILMVTGYNYDQYTLYLSHDGKYPVNYEKNSANPKLKIWRNNKASWDDLYDKDEQELNTISYDKWKDFKTFTEGTVKYYEFIPVKTRDGSNTNLYHLEFPEGVKIHSAFYKSDYPNVSTDFQEGHCDQFNIVDQDGYDISNPYRGSQFIYPENWWCANPNLMDDSLTGELNKDYKTYLGMHHFYMTPDLPSRVDLSFNLHDDTDGEETIYGITLFKIIGKVYSVYTEDERYANLYYLYVHTTPTADRLKAAGLSEGETDKNKINLALCEKTSPILMLVSDPNIVSSEQEFDTADDTRPVIYSDGLVEFKPMGDTEFNNPATHHPRFKAESKNKFYHLTLSDTYIDGNSDLNYLLNLNSDLRFRPNGEQKFEFIDVTGTQIWSAADKEDKLRINKWSNYYSGYYNNGGNNILTVLRPKAEYYKVVMGTNPDQVRYQIMSDEITLLPRPKMDYSSVLDTNHKPEEKLIYPYVDLSTILVWRNGYNINYNLEFLGNDDTTKATANLIYTRIPEGSQLQDEDAFYVTGEETPVEFSLGRYYIDPANVTKVKGTVIYEPNSNRATSSSVNTANGMSISYTTPSFSLPYDIPTFNDFTATANLPLKYSWDTTYSSDLSWTVDDSDYPRHYEISQYDETKQANKDDYIPEDATKIATTTIDHEAGTVSEAGKYSFKATINDATALYKGEEASDGSTFVTIGYRGRAVYNYAVPSGSSEDAYSAILADKVTKNYSAQPAGFKVVTMASSGDALTDQAYTPAVFDQATVSGVESVGIDADNSPVEYFNLQGQKVENPAAGIYIRRQGRNVAKVMIP